MKIILKRILAILAVVMVVALFGYKLATRNKTVVTEVPAKNKVTLLIASDYQVANATVPVIGQVDASASAFLKSELAARVDSVNVRIGDTVSAGDVLIELEHEILDAQVSQANAALDRSQSALNLRIAGATDEQVKQAEAAIGQVEASLNSVKTQRDIVELLSESSVKNAETALENANNSLQLSGKSQSSAVVSNSYENLVNTLQGSLTTVSNALRNSDNVLGIDNILGNDEFDQALLGTLDKAALDKAQKTYSDAKAAGQNIQELVLPLKKDSERSKIDSATIKVQEALQKVQSHLFDVDAVLQKTQPIFGLTQARLEGARASITASLAAVQAGIAALNAGQQAIKTASISLTTLQITQQKAEFDLEQVKKKVIEDKASADAAVVIQEKALLQAKAARDLLVAPPRAVDLAGLRASIREVEASYNVISRSREKAIVRSPISGKIAGVEVKRGDSVSPGQPLVSIVNPEGVRIKAYLNFRDRQFIEEGADVTLANGTAGIVSRVAPSINPTTNKVETEINLSGDAKDLTIGQFVQASVAMNKNVVENTRFFFPLSAVKVTSRSAYVYVINEENRVEEREIKLGRLIGNTVEVIEGITPEMLIISSVRGLVVGDEVEIQ